MGIYDYISPLLSLSHVICYIIDKIEKELKRTPTQ